MKRWLYLLGAMFLLAGVSFGATRLVVARTKSSDQPPPGIALAATPGPASKQEFEKALESFRQQAAQDEAKPRFLGRLGDFVITDSRAAVFAEYPCPNPRPLPHSAPIVPSELNLPLTQEQVLCSDGRVVAVAGPDGGRRYFSKEAIVEESAPLDRLDVIEIDGRPVLLVKPAVELMPTRIIVIQRPPTPETPGILLGVSIHGGTSAAVERVREIIRSSR